MNPVVRIGMIQSASSVTFHCSAAFDAMDKMGNVIFQGSSDKEYKIEIVKSTPAVFAYRVRLSIAETLHDAKVSQNVFKERGYDTILWNPGVVRPLADFTHDNREYWVVTKEFSTEEDANQFVSEYEPVGEVVVVKDIQEKSKGIVEIAGHQIQQGVRIIPREDSAMIYLNDVTVGIEFHWQHQRTQILPGVLEVNFNKQGQLVTINELDIETYLVSVNSSEMTFENPIELLKAQTIAARSTILATMGKHHYDEDFDLCSDDHCQCYHGVENISDASRVAAEETRGECILYKDRICDARYAKICGGVIENFADVWDNRKIPYLVAGVDGDEIVDQPLVTEQNVKSFVDSKPDVYCNTEKYPIDSKLPYNTTDLFRWVVSYSRQELEEIIKSRLKDDFGELVDLLPGERGASGRLIYLDIVGSKKNSRVGKELAIRRALSTSHLYSACFYIDRDLDASGKVKTFHLRGAGWGHGVGLCQVGATVMAQKGFKYKQILQHYYKNSNLTKLF